MLWDWTRGKGRGVSVFCNSCFRPFATRNQVLQKEKLKRPQPKRQDWRAHSCQRQKNHKVLVPSTDDGRGSETCQAVFTSRRAGLNGVRTALSNRGTEMKTVNAFRAREAYDLMIPRTHVRGERRSVRSAAGRGGNEDMYFGRSFLLPPRKGATTVDPESRRPRKVGRRTIKPGESRSIRRDARPARIQGGAAVAAPRTRAPCAPGTRGHERCGSFGENPGSNLATRTSQKGRGRLRSPAHDPVKFSRLCSRLLRPATPRRTALSRTTS